MLSLPFPFSLSFSGKQVGVILQTVHVRQQQLSGLQWDHVLWIVVLVPGRKQVWLGRPGMQSYDRSGQGGGKAGDKGKSGTAGEGCVVRDPVSSLVIVVRLTRQGSGQGKLLPIRHHEGQSFQVVPGAPGFLLK